ncbi:MAG TPA: VWA domain-containing protein [Noviherbaspirillum sp.]
MPEAEEVITDVARHATIYARALWQRHRKDSPPTVTVRDVSQRLDLLITAAFGAAYPIRVAQPPAPPTFLSKVFRRREGPPTKDALPATDGAAIWLPARLPPPDAAALDWYRVIALQQAMRAARGSAEHVGRLDSALHASLYLVLEADAADKALVTLLPGTRTALEAFRSAALARRPALARFPPDRRPVEELVRHLMAGHSLYPVPISPDATVALARELSEEITGRLPALRRQSAILFKDLWTGELYPASSARIAAESSGERTGQEPRADRPRSARLPRRPDVREAPEDEDDAHQGAWMVQTSQPHEQAEDPIGMQRPTDRDESTAAEEFADALSELPEARLVSTPGRPKEVLLSDDAPLPRTRQHTAAADAAPAPYRYPEWDYRSGSYLEPGATVHLLPPVEGEQEWVERTLQTHQSMLNLVRRRFEMLRAQRVRLRKQPEGDEIDLEACVDSQADFRAGVPRTQRLYQTYRPAKRDMAIMLLIDISGSTDSWVTANKRIIDVEREALLLVSIALQGLGEPYAVMGFSGEGPHGVTLRHIKSFEEAHSDHVARRIAALEPEHYTRAGAALRHATAALMRQAARHRLLLLLSDGKPNDIDEYEGRYGMEDLRQAVMESKLQGIHPFCLTIDRQAAAYLPAVFGPHQYALLPRPDMLPTVLLEWMKRLIAT